MEMLVGSGLSREWVPGIKNYLRIVAESIKKYLVQYNLTPGFKDGITKKKKKKGINIYRMLIRSSSRSEGDEVLFFLADSRHTLISRTSIGRDGESMLI